MNQIPPFVGNSDDNVHCVNAVYRMVSKAYLDRDYTWEEIDTITRSIPGKGTWSVPGDIELARRGISVTNIEPVDYSRLYIEGPPYLKQVVGEQSVAYYMDQSNIANIIPLIPEFLKLVHHQTRRATIDEVVGYLLAGKLIATEVDKSLLNKQSAFGLHFVLLYDFDGNHIHLHDPGLPPAPSRKLTIEEFKRCWSYPGSNGGIEVFSK